MRVHWIKNYEGTKGFYANGAVSLCGRQLKITQICYIFNQNYNNLCKICVRADIKRCKFPSQKFQKRRMYEAWKRQEYIVSARRREVLSTLKSKSLENEVIVVDRPTTLNTLRTDE